MTITTTGRFLAGLTAATVLLAGCGLASDDGDDTGGSEASDTSDTSGAESPAVEDTETSATQDAAPYPRAVTNCGREVTIESEPTSIVALEGGAETLFALGAADQVAGYFGGEAKGLPGELRTQAERTDYLGGSFPPPNLEAVLAPEPDLVVLYGLYPDTGITGQRLDELGVPYLQLSETCEKGADPTVEGYFTDVETIATAIGADETGRALVDGWRQQITAATATPVTTPPSVFVMGSTDPTEPFASGGGSLADDQIEIAGGTNVFGDTDQAFLSPSWEEVATRDPQVIVDGSGGLEESLAGLRTYLRKDAALSQMAAVRDDRFLAVDYYDNVPGPRVVDGILAMAEFFRQ